MYHCKRSFTLKKKLLLPNIEKMEIEQLRLSFFAVDMVFYIKETKSYSLWSFKPLGGKRKSFINLNTLMLKFLTFPRRYDKISLSVLAICVSFYQFFASILDIFVLQKSNGISLKQTVAALFQIQLTLNK